MLALTVPVALALSADSVTLRDGQRFNGTFENGSRNEVVMTLDNGYRRTFATNDIAILQFGDGSAPSYSRANRDRYRYGDREPYGNQGQSAGRYNDRYGDNNRSDSRYGESDRMRGDGIRYGAQGDRGVGDAIDREWQNTGGLNGYLGEALGGERVASDGAGHVREFRNGAVFWSPETGAHEVHGGIYLKYKELGAERSRLGYPVSDEAEAPDGYGRVSRFQHGSIYWDADNGAHVDTRR